MLIGKNRKFMKKVCIIGPFGFGKELLNGQTVKCIFVKEVLEKGYGKDEIKTIDTFGSVTVLIKCLYKLFLNFFRCENIVMLPAQNGVRIFTPFCLFINRIFNRQLHYIVIGGWLAEFTKVHSKLANRLKKYDKIYVETSTMKKALEKQGFNNIVLLPNCKELPILKEEELVYSHRKPYKLCTFSRVTPKKGIDDAINAVKCINEEAGKIIFVLDIYGQVDEAEIEWFNKIKERLPSYIHYCGLVPYDKSVEVLRNYFALLFPSRFYTEGIPGTLIDAYAAGVPVISSRWESFLDVVDENIVGLGFEFGNTEELKEILKYISENPEYLNRMKKSCLKKAELYSSKNVLQILKQHL